uniref:Uncharacterized protein n=1 Tax=Anguilla anguilla TaxID=7936 RepID=A0A0E9W3A1_ANGAN
MYTHSTYMLCVQTCFYQHATCMYCQSWGDQREKKCIDCKMSQFHKA